MLNQQRRIGQKSIVESSLRRPISSQKSIKKVYQKIKYALLGSCLCLTSNYAFADSVPPLDGAAKWLVGTLISIAVTVLGLQIMHNLWQVNQGHKEWRDVVKPIFITALIVATPTCVVALVAVLK